MAHAELNADVRQLGTGRFSTIDRHDDPVFLGDGRHPNIVSRAWRKTVENVQDADLLPMKSHQFSQRLGKWTTEAFIEEKLRWFGIHAATASDS
jgi:hypothetical protein